MTLQCRGHNERFGAVVAGEPLLPRVDLAVVAQRARLRQNLEIKSHEMGRGRGGGGSLAAALSLIVVFVLSFIRNPHISTSFRPRYRYQPTVPIPSVVDPE